MTTPFLPTDVAEIINAFNPSLNLRSASRTLRDIVDRNAVLLVENLRNKYRGMRNALMSTSKNPDRYSSIFTSLQDAIIARDVKILSPILQYRGYLPVPWDQLLFSCMFKFSEASGDR